jgi:peptidoglycan hydrolase CwlO-like protein
MQRRAHHQRELEDKARRVDKRRRKLEEAGRMLEKERLRIEDEFNQTQHQLGVLASKQTTRKEAAKLRKDVKRDTSEREGKLAKLSKEADAPKRRKESVKDLGDGFAKSNAPEEQGKPLDMAMRTARLVFYRRDRQEPAQRAPGVRAGVLTSCMEGIGL